jgi:hypothetical protein
MSCILLAWWAVQEPALSESGHSTQNELEEELLSAVFD